MVGFPCTPFSSRRGGRSETFQEEAALPYLAFCEEIRSCRQDAFLAENVMGLTTSMYGGRRCIDV
eukprot:9487742-Alexandrium_andersonii.AAC.1